MTKQASAIMFAAGEPPQLWADGVKNVLAVAPGNPAGVTSVTDTLELGRGGRGSIDYWKGRCSFFALSSRRQPEAVLQTMTAAFADPKRVYGHGSVNFAGDAVRSPVALPAYATASAGSPAVVNVATASYDPGALTLSCTAASLASGNGTLTRSGVNLTLTPASGSAAGDAMVADFTVANSSGKTSSGRVYVTVAATAGAGEEYPPLTGTLRSINSQADWDAAKGVAAKGDHLVLANGLAINPGGNWTKAGTLAEPIVIRAASNQSPRFSGKLTLAAPHVQVWGMRFGTIGLALGTGTAQVGQRIRRCAWNGATFTSSSGNILASITSGGAKIEYCEMTNMVFARGFWGNDSRNIEIRRCLFKDWTGTGAQTREPITIGEGANTHTLDAKWLIEYCLFTNINQDNQENEAISIKSSNNTVQFSCFNNARNPNQRFGDGNRYYALRLTGNSEIEVHGKNHVLNSVWSDRDINLVKGNCDGSLNGQPTNSHPSAYNVKLIGCRASVTLGASASGSFNAKQIILEGHVGTITDTQGGHFYTQTSTPSEPIVTPPTLTVADVGVSAGL